MKKILLALLAITAIVGCGKNEKAQIESESSTLKIVYKDLSPKDEMDKKYISAVKERMEKLGMNSKFEVIEMPSGNYAEKLNLMIASGEIPDIIYFQGGDLQLAHQGILEDLRPYIKKSESIKKIMYPHNEARVENYPYLLWIKPLSTKVPYIRKDVLAKLPNAENLLANPTIENYKLLMKDLKDNGYQFSITTTGNTAELDEMFNQAFGINKTWLKDENGKIIHHMVSPQEKEKLTFYHELYKNGLLDKEYLIKKWDTKEKSFYENEIGIIFGTAGKVADIISGKMIKTNGEDSSLVALPPAKGIYQGYLPLDITKESRGIAISSTSKNKDEAFKFLEFFSTEEGQELDRLGYQDIHYTLENGEVKLTEKSGEWYARFWEPLSMKLKNDDKINLFGEAGNQSLDLANKFYVADNTFLYQEEDLFKIDALNNLYREFSADVITGKKPIDSFSVFIDQWYKNGGKELTEKANQKLN